MKQLFKYMSEPYFLFSEGYIRLTQISALNDPFEALFCRSSLNTLAKEFEYDTIPPDLSYSDYVDQGLNKVGVISLSENKENLLMWAHYADEHKGLVAGISYHPDTDYLRLFAHLLPVNPLFSSSWDGYSLFDGSPKPVSYRKSPRYRNDKFDYDYSNIAAESGDQCLYEVCLQKSDEWIYEQEHRIVLRLEQADCVIAPRKLIQAAVDSGQFPFLKRFIKSRATSLNANKSCYVINLAEIEDEIDRIVYAQFLAGLSEHKETIYLMKLSPSAINNCIFGLNSGLSKQGFDVSYARKTGYLDFWHARKCIDRYCLEFEEL